MEFEQCPKCNSEWTFLESSGRFDSYLVYRLRCMCGWSEEFYVETYIPDKDTVLQREMEILKWKMQKKKSGGKGGKLRKLREVRGTCVICGKEFSVLTLGSPKTCPGECRKTLKRIRSSDRLSRSIPLIKKQLIPRQLGA